MKAPLFETVLLLLLASNLSFGQVVDSKDASRFNIAVLGVLDEYERTCTFSEKNDRRDFLRLFLEKDDPCIYNDLLGTARYQALISPEAYSSPSGKDGSFLIRSSISDVRKEGGITYSDGKLHRRISFTKYVMIIDATVYSGSQGGVLFDSSQSYESSPDFRLYMDLAYDPQSGDCRIEAIRAAEEKPASPLDDSRFSVIVASDEKYDKDLTSRGKKLQFNEFGQAVAYQDDLDVDNGDVKLKTTQRAWGNSYDVLEVDFKPIRFRSKFYWNTALGKAFDIETSYAPMQSSSSAMNFGADLGFEKSLSKTFRLGAYTGVGLSLGKIGLEAKNIKYDLKYLTPKRSYSFSAKESLSIIDLIVPAYLESEIDLTDWLALDIDLGARFYLNRETNLGPYEISGAFGPTVVNAVFSSFKDPADYTRTAYDIALFGNLEFDFALIKKALYAFFSFSYEHGLNPVYDSGLRTYFDEATSVYPFYYSPISGTDNPMRSLIGSVRYSRKATCFAAGIKLKF